MSTCKLCGADITFVKTKLGATMPLDTEPNPDGNVEMVPGDDGEQVAVVTGNLTLFHQDQVRYMPHWATCTGDISKVRNR